MFMNILLKIVSPIIEKFLSGAILAGIKALEAKYPGFAGIINQLIMMVEQGVTPAAIMSHLNAMPEKAKG